MKKLTFILVFGLSVGIAFGDGGGTASYYQQPATESSVTYESRRTRDATLEEAQSTRRLIVGVGFVLFLTQIILAMVLNRKSRRRQERTKDQLLRRLSGISEFLEKKLPD